MVDIRKELWEIAKDYSWGEYRPTSSRGRAECEAVARG